ncbi:MAG: UDP-2,3-diacylglucosamine diphosphatase [FCB group bacterium]|jgi:UDP-2,3-diacylglucosamine hydrolase
MVYFISDVHLGFLEREKDYELESLLIRFLEAISADCETLYIVGDLFDYWFDYKTVVPKYFYRTLTVLKKLREKGIKIEYIIGNHDFGHNDFFEKELDIRIYRDDIEREINGKKFYLSHGDGKLNQDTGYKILKKVLQNKFALWLYKLLHPNIGIGLALSSSRRSREYTDNKNFGEKEGMVEFAQAKIDEGFDYVIMGHRHRVIEKELGKGKYFNLGGWLRQPTFGRFDSEKMELVDVREYLGK